LVLTFTLPARSLDRQALADHPSIEIYRAGLPPGSAPDKQTAWRLAYTVPSEQVDRYLQGNRVEFHDPLAPDQFAGAAGSSLAYKIRTRAGKARESADSNVVTARIYPPPEAPREVKTMVTEDAIEISWTDHSVVLNSRPAVAYRVYREELEEPAPDAGNAEKPTVKAPFAVIGETSGSPLQLQDRHFEFGRTYVYIVRSVAQYGTDAVESADSAPATVTPREIFPPAAPTNLEVAVVPMTPQAAAYVELSWEISSEADFAGYFVYRSEAEDLPGERISTEILLSPTFRDISVLPGGRYYYRVSAVDRAGNESPKSSAAEADIP
jgi:hypothetical protein